MILLKIEEQVLENKKVEDMAGQLKVKNKGKNKTLD